MTDIKELRKKIREYEKESIRLLKIQVKQTN